MSNLYKPISEWGKATYGDHEVVELDLSVADEADALRNYHLQLVPRKYKVLSTNYFPGQGEIFETTYPRENEEALIAGGHIERVEDEKPAKKTAAKKKTSSDD